MLQSSVRCSYIFTITVVWWNQEQRARFLQMHFYDEEAVDCRKDFTWIVIFTLACIALGCLTMLVAYYFNKLKQPHQIGTNVASKGTDISMNSYFGASTASTLSTASTASSMYPMDAYTKNDGLIRGQDPWFIRANSHY